MLWGIIFSLRWFMIQMAPTMMMEMIERVEAKTTKFQRVPFSLKTLRKKIDWAIA